MSKTHDQNFKNLILDYPIEAIKFFAPQEAKHLEQPVKVIPLRQEQLKKQLGNRYRELDTPLLLEWPDGRKEAMILEQYAELTLEEQQQYHQFYMNDEETGENKMGLKQFLREEGIKQGRQEGEIDLLLRLMQKKFVTLPGNIETKIKNASREHIKKWSDKLLAANKIDEVLT